MHASTRTRARRFGVWLGLPLAAALTLAACGGGDSSSGGGSKAANGCKATPPNTAGAVNNVGNTPANVPGFDGKTIKVGVLSVQSGVPSAKFANDILTNGNKVYWDGVNAKGGIAGKYKVELVTADTQYSGQVAPQAYEKIKGSVVAVNQVFGTGVTNAILPTMTSDNITGGPATLDSEWVCETNLFPISSPYQIQAINGMDWWVKKSGKSSVVCTIVQDDAYGVATNEGVDYAAKQMGFKVKTRQKYPITATDLTAQVQALKDNGCQAVVAGVLASNLGAIGDKAQSIGLKTQFIGMSPSFFPTVAGNAYLQQNYVVVSEGATWGDTSVKGMAQMISDLDTYAASAAKSPFTQSQYFSYGYAQSWALDQILTKAVANGDLSHGGVQKAMGEIGELKFDGLLANYTYGAGVADRNPPRSNNIYSIAAGTPGSLKVVESNVASDAAKSYTVGG